MLGTCQDGGECCGKAIGKVNPSTLGKTTSLKYTVVVVVVVVVCSCFLQLYRFGETFDCQKMPLLFYNFSCSALY